MELLFVRYNWLSCTSGNSGFDSELHTGITGHWIVCSGVGRIYADRRQVSSISLSRQKITELFVWVGQDPTGKTHKSVKMTGVTETLEAEVLLPEVGHQGCWLLPEMALRYKHNSLEYKHGIAMLKMSKYPMELMM
jgi:hypothetical protein